MQVKQWSGLSDRQKKPFLDTAAASTELWHSTGAFLCVDNRRSLVRVNGREIDRSSIAWNGMHLEPKSKGLLSENVPRW